MFRTSPMFWSTRRGRWNGGTIGRRPAFAAGRTILHVLYAEPDKTLAGVANFLSDPKRPIQTTLRAMMTVPTPRSIPGGRRRVLPSQAIPITPATCRTWAMPWAPGSGYTGDSADLDAAIDLGQQVARAAGPGHPARAGRLSNLGVLMLTRFEHAGDRRDLDAAIEIGQQAVDLAGPGHPERAIYLSNLCNALRTRFEYTGDRADLDAAVAAGRQAAGAAAPGHPGRGTYLLNLAASLFRRFEVSGTHGDLDAAIDVGQQAVDLAGQGHPERARRLSNLCNVLRTRFEYTGDRADLDRADRCAVLRGSVDAVAPAEPRSCQLPGGPGRQLAPPF